jgi:hypothetical protein
VGGARREEFESYDSFQAKVFSFVDDTHAAPADFFEHSVVGDGVADQVGIQWRR